MKFEFELEAKRMEEERMRRRSEQEHELRVLQMLVALSRPQVQQQYPVAPAHAPPSFFTQLQPTQSSPGSLYTGNHSQNCSPTVGGSLSETSGDVRYDILSNLTFN